jgi:hypothetical protein
MPACLPPIACKPWSAVRLSRRIGARQTADDVTSAANRSRRQQRAHPYHGCALPTELGGQVTAFAVRRRYSSVLRIKRPNIKHASTSSAEDDTQSLRHRAASRSRNGSGEIAADRVLHVQRFTLPLGINTAAQPRLGRRPPPATVLTSEHHPPQALDDMAERPEVPGRPGHVQRLVQVLLEAGPVGVRQGGTDLLNLSNSSGPMVGSAPLTPWFLASRPVFRS